MFQLMYIINSEKVPSESCTLLEIFYFV
uniref:Uncharacterized protein n=1 Tax=Arundo donax TaxID=35708 RepID=A0A0A9CHQ9_ARUDO